MLVPLAERLRLETRDLHAVVERSGAMGELLRGRLPLPAYGALLNNLHALYTALEAALDRCADRAWLRPVRLPGLPRAAALASDLGALALRAPPLEEAAEAYVQRLHALGAARAPALLAHAYVRYMGDLNGGQALRRLVGRAYGLGGSVTRFYDFGGAEQVRALADAFRRGLDAPVLTATGADRVVAEARWAFQQHQRLFEQLAARDLR